MDSGQGGIELLEGVEGRAYVRLVAVAPDDEGIARLRHLDAVVAPKPPPKWKATCWEYPDLVFVAGDISALALAGILAGVGEKAYTVGDYRVRAPSLRSEIQWQRLPSRAMYSRLSLPWPTRQLVVNPAEQSPALDQGGGILCGPRGPSFLNAQIAFDVFFYGERSSIGAHQPPAELARIRIADARAYIRSVRVEDVRLAVTVDGPDAAACRIDLSSGTLRGDATVDSEGAASLPLPGGLPGDAALFLTLEDHWADYRPLGAQFVRSDADWRASGVEFAIEEEPGRSLEILLNSGETPEVEYKREISQAVPSKRRFLKTVAAFANERGGAIVIGVDPDELTRVGLSSDHDDTTHRDRIGDLIRAIVRPTPRHEVTIERWDDRRFAVVRVESGDQKPYGIQFGDKPVEHYVRRGASTYPATAAEVRYLARLRDDPGRG